MHYENLFSRADLYQAQNDGLVRINLHDDLPLGVCTYTEKAQFDNIWTPVTINCRGLVIDFETGKIVGLTLPKFFNSNQHNHGQVSGPIPNKRFIVPEHWAPPLPDEPFEIFEKVDGSLITVFFSHGRWMTASKGSFNSDQAKWAQARVNHRQYALREGLTYIAEAVYPANRIVVDYKGREDLVLLAVRDTSDGAELPLSVVENSWRGIGSVVKSWGLLSKDFLTGLENMARDGLDLNGDARNGVEEEGYVVRFVSGVRAKVKLADYLVAHKLFTNTNERTVWEWLSTGQDLSDILSVVPDEYADWVREVAADLLNAHTTKVCEVSAAYMRVISARPDKPSRREFAEKATKTPFASPLFLLYDDKDRAVSDWAWKQLKPVGSTASAFSNNEA
jgi:RNA ligase